MPKSNDPLLAELAGTGAELETLETPTPDVADPMAVVPVPAADSHVAAADAKHSTAAGGMGYSIRIRGQYYARMGEKQKEIRSFERDVRLPSLDKALSVIRRKLLPTLLAKADPQFAALRVCEIVDVKPLSPTTPESQSLQFMGRDRLVAYIREYGVPLDPTLPDYKDTATLREAVMDHKVNPRGFEEREARRRADRAETAAVLALNDV